MLLILTYQRIYYDLLMKFLYYKYSYTMDDIYQNTLHIGVLYLTILAITNTPKYVKKLLKS
jgi:hypothetical protein